MLACTLALVAVIVLANVVALIAGWVISRLPEKRFVPPPPSTVESDRCTYMFPDGYTRCKAHGPHDQHRKGYP